MKKNPNVILMLVDDLGYGDLSCLNENSKIKTENIDALSANAAVFTDAHSTSALCTPSRYGLLTGRYNWRSRLKSNVLPGGADPLIEEGRMTLATMFKQSGYYTACVGKWHLGLGWSRKEFDGREYGIEDEISEARNSGRANPFRLDGMDIDFSKPLSVSPNDYGFDYFFGLPASLDQPPYTYIENRNALYMPDHVSGVFPLDRVRATQQQLWQRGPAAKEYVHENVISEMNEKVLDIIENHSEEPFFIYYPTPAVHGPLLPPEGFKGKSGLNDYADMVLYVDHMVGEISAKLKEKGVFEDTIFIFTSDNGCSGVADFDLLKAHGHNPSYIFRGEKSDIYEGGHRVPAIVSYPGQFAEREEKNGMVCLADFFATFAELLGTSVPDNAGEDSFSMLPIIRGEQDCVRDSIVHSSGDGSFSIRDSEWKLEFCRGAGGMNPADIEPTTSDECPYQLYDLNCDISEKRNRAAEHPEVISRMKAQLLELIQNGRSTPGEKQNTLIPPNWEKYFSLLD